MKVCVAGGYDTVNYGDYASFHGLRTLVTAEKSDSVFTVLSRHPRDEFGKDFPDVTMLQNLDFPDKKAAIGKALRGFNSGDEGGELAAVAQEIASSDLLLIGNGRLLVDKTLGPARGPLPYFFFLASLAQVSDTRVGLYSMTLVPPKSPRGWDLLRKALHLCDFLLLRDWRSRRLAIELGVQPSRIQVLPDFAWMLASEDGGKKRGNSNFSRGNLGVNFRQQSLGFSLSPTQVAQAISPLQAVFNFRPIASQTYNVPGSTDADDRLANQAVLETLGLRVDHHQEKGLWGLLREYDNCDALLTMRRHGLILALARGIPAILWATESNSSVLAHGLRDFVVTKSRAFNSTSFKRQISGQRDPTTVAIAQREKLRKDFNIAVLVGAS